MYIATSSDYALLCHLAMAYQRNCSHVISVLAKHSETNNSCFDMYALTRCECSTTQGQQVTIIKVLRAKGALNKSHKKIP